MWPQKRSSITDKVVEGTETVITKAIGGLVLTVIVAGIKSVIGLESREPKERVLREKKELKNAPPAPAPATPLKGWRTIADKDGNPIKLLNQDTGETKDL